MRINCQPTWEGPSGEIIKEMLVNAFALALASYVYKNRYLCVRRDMRTNIEIEDDFLNEYTTLSGAKTKRGAIHKVLVDAIMLRKKDSWQN